jgi:hypothetical protein
MNWPLVSLVTVVVLAMVAGLVLLAVRDDDRGSPPGDRIVGSGTVIAETRSVSGFDGVTLMSAGRIVLTQGTEESLTIEADDNLMAFLKTEVSGGSLRISAERDGEAYNLDPTGEVVFRINVIDLKDLQVFGAGDIEMSSLRTGRLDVTVMGSADVQIGDLSADELRVEVPGFANIDIAGRAPTQELRWFGAGSYDGGDLQSQTADIAVLGSATIKVWAIETLDVSITGAGTIEYYGTPTLSQNVTGVGAIRGLGDK